MHFFSIDGMHLSFCQLSTSDRSVRLPIRTFPSRSDRNPLSVAVGHPIFVECFGLLLALGRNKEDEIRERRQTGAITPPDIPEIGVKPNKLKCAHSSSSSSSFHQTCDDGDRIPFLYLNDANASQSGGKSPQRSPPRIGQLPGKTKTFH